MSKKIIYSLLLSLVFWGCDKEYFQWNLDKVYRLPTVNTIRSNNVYNTGATIYGETINDGGSIITQRGVCFSTNQNPTIADNITNNGTGIGTFTSLLTNLNAGTTYYIRAYAINEVGTAYGNQISLTTTNVSATPPLLTTASASGISNNSVTSGGTITSDGGSAVTQRGVCWSTNQNPTIADNITNNGTGIGSFTSSLTNLNANTSYYIRAYAINGVGTAYGNQISFTTANNSLSLPILTTASASGISTNSCSSGGTITSDGGSAVSQRGVCWSTNQNPTIAYWDQARQIKVQVEQVLHEHLLRNLSNRSKGNFDFAMRIIFDTLGVNNSLYNLSSEDRELKSTIDKLLKPIILSGLYFSATDTLFISSSWHTERVKVKSSFRGMDFSKSNIWNDDIRTLIANSPSKYGIFNFKIQQVTINGLSNSRVSFVDHRVGSSVISNLVKSMILPGWGRRRVDFGKPNKKFGEIVIIGSSAFGAEVYAQSLLSAYERDPSRDDLFADAEMWHRISLGLAAVGALDYLNEQGFVLIKSFRNIRESRRTDKMNKNWTRTNIALGKR